MPKSLGPIQALSPGLLSLLSLKQLGLNPSTLSDEVLLTMETVDWLMQNQIEAVTGNTVALTATGVFGFAVQVPAGEIWYVHSATIMCDIIAAEAIRARLGYVWDRGLANPPAHPLSEWWTASAVTNPRLAIGASRLKMFLPANRALVLLADLVTTAATIDCTMEAMITRLRV